MTDYQARKRQRAIAYFRHRFGFRLERCTACNGSGHYDGPGAPRCSACSGAGRTWKRPPALETRAQEHLIALYRWSP